MRGYLIDTYHYDGTDRRSVWMTDDRSTVEAALNAYYRSWEVLVTHQAHDARNYYGISDLVDRRFSVTLNGQPYATLHVEDSDAVWLTPAKPSASI